MAQYETIIRVMEEERDYYKKEYEVLKAVKKSSSSARATPTKVCLLELLIFLKKLSWVFWYFCQDNILVLFNNGENHFVILYKYSVAVPVALIEFCRVSRLMTQNFQR